MNASMQQGLVCAAGLSGVLALGMLLSVRAEAQSGADTVVIPGGSSVRSSVTPRRPDKVIANTATESQVANASLTDRVVTRLGQQQDELTFTVTNPTNNPIHYEFNSGKKFNVEVVDASGKLVWDMADHKIFSPLVTKLTVSPGKSKSFEAIWNRRDDQDHPVPSGTYSAVAKLLPIPRIVVSGTSTLDALREGRDPTNVGTPTPPSQMTGADVAQSGRVAQSNVTPSVQARTQIVVSR